MPSLIAINVNELAIKRNYSGARFLAACGGSFIRLQRTVPPQAAQSAANKLLRTAAGGEESPE